LNKPTAQDENGVPAPASRGALGRARAIANRAFAETVVEPNGHGNGHRAGSGGEHAVAGPAVERAVAGPADQGQQDPGDGVRPAG